MECMQKNAQTKCVRMQSTLEQKITNSRENIELNCTSIHWPGFFSIIVRRYKVDFDKSIWSRSIRKNITFLYSKNHTFCSFHNTIKCLLTTNHFLFHVHRPNNFTYFMSYWDYIEYVCDRFVFLWCQQRYKMQAPSPILDNE